MMILTSKLYRWVSFARLVAFASFAASRTRFWFLVDICTDPWSIPATYHLIWIWSRLQKNAAACLWFVLEHRTAHLLGCSRDRTRCSNLIRYVLALDCSILSMYSCRSILLRSRASHALISHVSSSSQLIVAIIISRM